MKSLYFFLATLLALSCKQAKKTEPIQPSPFPKQEQPVFFPVTNYLQGQLLELQKKGISPLKITSVNNLADSSWLKVDKIEEELSTFFTPVIDSTNLVKIFSEKRFLDQTLDAITLTYDPVSNLSDTFGLLHWDVYIDPNSNRVRRIYMLKRLTPVSTQQLTWQSDKWCKIVTVTKDKKGNSFVEKEVTLKWEL